MESSAGRFYLFVGRAAREERSRAVAVGQPSANRPIGPKKRAKPKWKSKTTGFWGFVIFFVPILHGCVQR